MSKTIPNSIRVWYHKNCSDGFAAAMVLWLYYQPRARSGASEVIFEPVAYGEDPPYWEARDMIWIVDFSFPRAQLEAIAARASVTVIDHHPTAEEELRGLEYAHFSDRSGAVATWQHLFKEPVPELLLYVEDRDFWRWALPDSRAVSYALRHVEQDFATWFALDVKDLRRDGLAMLRMVDATVQSIAEKAMPAELLGHKILAVNSACFASELGHVLGERSPSLIGAVWHQDGDVIHWELRSEKNGPHVGNIAKTIGSNALGGGGRAHAAGFRCKASDMPSQALGISW